MTPSYARLTLLIFLTGSWPLVSACTGNGRAVGASQENLSCSSRMTVQYEPGSISLVGEELFPIAHRLRLPFAGASLDYSNQYLTVVVLEFSAQCDDRFKFAAMIASEWKSGKDGVSIEVTN